MEPNKNQIPNLRFGILVKLIQFKFVFDMQTIKHLYALHCRLNRKANRAQIIKKNKYRNNFREFSKHEDCDMSKIMQNLVVLMAPSKDAHDHSLKAGNMILNRFCIDEEAAFECSGVNYLKKPSFRIKEREFKVEGKVKG